MSNSFSSKFKHLFIFTSIFITIALFQNCSPNSFQTMPSNILQISENINGQLNLPSENDDTEKNDPDSPTIPTGIIYYVSTAGNDNNPGTSAEPFKTVQGAINFGLKPGNTVLIKAGSYPAFELKNLNGSSGKPITFKPATSNERVIIDRNLSSGNPYRNIDFYGGSYITMEGLELIDSDSSPAPTSCAGSESGAGRNAIKFSRGTTNDKLYPHHIILSNLHIHGLRGTAIIVTTDPKFVNIAAKDFRLQSSSPAIDKGTPLAEVPNDFRGVARPRGTTHDIGAYEY